MSQVTSADSQDRLLDAAAQLIVSRGPGAVTMSAIAAEAGVSRMTAYRRYADKHALLSELFNRELAAILEESVAGSDGTQAQRIIATVTNAVQRIAEHPLMRAVLAHEPEQLTEWMTARLGRTQRRAREVLRELVVAGQTEGSVRHGDPDRMALTLVLVAQTFVFAHDLGARNDELSILVKGYL